MGLADDLAASRRDANTKDTLGRIAEMIERQGIDLADIGSVKRVSMWQTVTKDADGEVTTHDLTGIQFSPAWEDGPQWPVVQPAPAHTIRAPKLRARRDTAWEIAVVLPDMQIGYWRDRDGNLEPTHDEDALDVALAIVRDARPHQVVLVGDNLDLPELGKYRLSPAYALTTQATLDRAARLAAQLRAAAPDATIVWLAGNHEERLPNYILDNAKAAFGLRQGMTPDGWPVLSVPHLCRLDDHHITYLPGYPASAHWINQKLRVIHGDRVKSGGSTAHAYLAHEKTSVIYGHIHRREWAERTRDDHDGPRTILAASPGTLARVDGAVPSTKGGIDLDGRPLVRHEDWQQGIAIIAYQPGDAPFHLELVPIRDGWAYWRGKDYQA